MTHNLLGLLATSTLQFLLIPTQAYADGELSCSHTYIFSFLTFFLENYFSN